MAVEARRGCGFRKVGGLYLVADGAGHRCDQLPFPLTICPCCGAGIKQTRGWTWVDVPTLFDSEHHRPNCVDDFPCPLCQAPAAMGRAGLLWIGAQFYPTAADFIHEADRLGISRRITAVPRGFQVGETWVLLAHPKGMHCSDCLGSGLGLGLSGVGALRAKCERCAGAGTMAAIFRVVRPRAIEKIVTVTQSEDAAAMADLEHKGITPVIVPDDDPDHQGTVYDDAAEGELFPVGVGHETT